MMDCMEIRLEDTLSGDIVAEDITGSSGVTWVSRDTTLNAFLIGRLKELGISRIKVFAGAGLGSRLAEIHNLHRSGVTALRHMIQGLIAGRSVAHKEVQLVTDKIIRSANDLEGVAKCLLQLRMADEYTFSHCVNTAFYCMLIAVWLGLPEADIRRAIQAGLLHDVGKVRIPDDILNKQGTLTREEYEVIKKHPEEGFELVKQIEGLDAEIHNAVLYHHERMDSSGYPCRMPATSIGLLARIVAVADVYDAMTSDRVYKKGCSPFAAFRMFQTEGAGNFDPEVVSPFLKRLSANYVGSRVRLSDGTEGELVHIPPHDLLSPVVRTENGRILNLLEYPDLTITAIRP